MSNMRDDSIRVGHALSVVWVLHGHCPSGVHLALHNTLEYCSTSLDPVMHLLCVAVVHGSLN